MYSIGSFDISHDASTFGPEPFITNGEYAPDGGTDWNDPRYATVLPPCATAANSKCLNGATTGALTVDLGANFPVSQLKVQADRHQFQVDISSDGASWSPLWTIPLNNQSGLSTRTSPPFAGAARYLRVYGTAGDDNNYSVADLTVTTPTAKTPCAYDSGANAGQAFSCSYDGQFSTQIVPPSGIGIPISFTVTLLEAKASCDDPGLPGSSTITTDRGSSPQTCSATLNVNPSTPNLAGGFCSGLCASAPVGAPPAVMSYTQLAGFEFEVNNLTCSPGFDSKLTPAVVGTVAAEAAGAVQTLFNVLFEAPDAGPKHFIPYPGTCAPPPAAAVLAASLSTLLSLEISADAWKNGGNREAALNRLANVRRAIETGRTQEAIKQLASLRQRFDGCGASADPNDWMTDCGIQVRIREAIDALMQRLGKSVGGA